MRKQKKTIWVVLLAIAFVLTFSLPAAADQSRGVSSVDGQAPAATEIAPVFPDVAANHPNALFINYLANKGLIKGFPDGTFRPQAGLSRAEAAAMLVRVAGLAPGTGSSRFSDVTTNHWAAGAIEAAAAAGLLHGYPDGTFRPNAVLTRAEGVALFMRLSNQPDPGVALPPLEDLKPGSWAARPVAVAVAAEMIGLSADKKQFLPGSPFTRSDLARMLGILLTREPSLSQSTLNGELKAIKGTVTVTREENKTTVKVNDGMVIKPGDLIATGPGSAAEIVFPDGTGLLLEENTELFVDEARGRSYIKTGGKTNTSVDWLDLDLNRGKMFFALATRYEGLPPGSGKVAAGLAGYPQVAALDDVFMAGGGLDNLLAANDTTVKNNATVGPDGKPLPWFQVTQSKRVRVKVDMPWGVAGIRGTFGMVYTPCGMNLLTGEGKLTAGGKTVELKAGQRSVVPARGAEPQTPTPMSARDLKEWTGKLVLEWAQERAQDIQNNLEALTPPAPPVDEQPEQQPLEKPQPETTTSVTDVIDQALDDAEQGAETTTSSSGGGHSGSNQGQNEALTITSVSVENEKVTLTLSKEVVSAYLETEEGYWHPVITVDGQNYNIGIWDNEDNWGVSIDNVWFSGSQVILSAYGGESDKQYVARLYTGTYTGPGEESNFNIVAESSSFLLTSGVDETPPVFADGYPNYDPATLTANSVDLLVQTNEYVTIYYVALSVEDTVYAPSEAMDVVNWASDPENPSLPQVRSWSGSSGYLPADITHKITVDSLIGNSSYNFYVVAEDAWGNLSDLKTVEITTPVDTTAPEFATEFPKYDNITANSVDLLVQTNEFGYVYYVAFSATDAGTVEDTFYNGNAPSPEDIKSWALEKSSPPGVNNFWIGYSSLEPNQVQVMNITGLNSNSAYRIYIVAEDVVTESQSTNMTSVYAIEITTHNATPQDEVKLISASDEVVTLFFSEEINEAYIDQDGAWFPVVETFNGTERKYYKIWIVDDSGQYSMSLHEVGWNPESNTVQVWTLGAMPGTNYNLTVYRGTEDVYGDMIYDQVVLNTSYTYSFSGFSPVGGLNLYTARKGHTSTLFGNNILIAGGWGDQGELGTAELFNIDTQGLSVVDMVYQRGGHAATLLDDGMILITGGSNQGTLLDSAEIYDPVANTFTVVSGNMTSARSDHTATLLQNGKVLIAGGWGDGGAILDSAEIYDPAAGTFTPAGNMSSGRAQHTATLLKDGKVLIAGGRGDGGVILGSAEIFDPATNTFTPVDDNMLSERVWHTATLMEDGNVLIAGGQNGSNELSSAEIYIAGGGYFTEAGDYNMSIARAGHTATLLGDGSILIAGGWSSNNELNSAELFYPDLGVFIPINNMLDPRSGHTATLLEDGRVIIIGGYDGSGFLSNAEFWLPGTP